MAWTRCRTGTMQHCWRFRAVFQQISSCFGSGISRREVRVLGVWMTTFVWPFPQEILQTVRLMFSVPSFRSKSPIAGRRSHQFEAPIPAPVVSRFCEAWGSPVHIDEVAAVPPGREAQKFCRWLLAAQLPAPLDESNVNERHICRYVAASRGIPGQRSFPVACVPHLWA